MKKLIYYISALALCTLSFTSCSDLLDEDPKSDIRKNQYMNNASEANNVLLGVYRNMVADNLYGMNLSCIFDLTNDWHNVKETVPVVSVNIQLMHSIPTIRMYKIHGHPYIVLFIAPTTL